MSATELPTHFLPSESEPALYAKWVENGYFTANASSSKLPYTIVIPPPNVTGSLHIGHALDHTLQDILIRRKRMQGFEALWLPGMDHAGIATQNVVEKQLAAEGLSRHDLGREAFVEKVWKWKAESGGAILGQMKRRGWCQFGVNGGEAAAADQGVTAGLGDGAFRFILPIDATSVMGAHVTKLLVFDGRVDMPPKVVDQLRVTHLAGVVQHPHRLGMARIPGTDLRVSGIGRFAGGVARLNSQNTGHFFKVCLDAPETATGKQGVSHGLAVDHGCSLHLGGCGQGSRRLTSAGRQAGRASGQQKRDSGQSHGEPTQGPQNGWLVHGHVLKAGSVWPSGTNAKATPLLQNRLPVGLGPSSNT